MLNVEFWILNAEAQWKSRPWFGIE